MIDIDRVRPVERRKAGELFRLVEKWMSESGGK